MGQTRLKASVLKASALETSRVRRAPTGAALLQDRVTNAVTKACFREWARTGYAALKMEAVARRAGVGKAALYRRWPSKLEMATDLLTRVGIPLARVPDQGSLEADVRTLLEQTLRLLQHPLVKRILPDLHAEMWRTPALAEAVQNGIQKERRKVGEQLLERAIARGELSPELDRALALDLFAPLYWRVIVTDGPTPPEYVDTLTKVISSGLRAL